MCDDDFDDAENARDEEEAERMKYNNYNQLCKSIDRITLLDIVLAKDCVLNIIL